MKKLLTLIIFIWFGVISFSYALEVPPEDCNIRMMLEDGSCFDILNLKSKIDHITFNKR